MTTALDGLEYLSDLDARLREDIDANPLVSSESIGERFARFHSDNPWVYERLRHLALDMVDKGHQKVGIGMLWEVLRWQTLSAAKVSVEHGTPKLNDHYRSRYARMLMDREPRLAGVFETRTLRS